MTIDRRKTGWLSTSFHSELREVLTHTLFRYSQTCPIYCCMPDHIHLLWIGIRDQSDQRKAAAYFRKQLNPILQERGARFQRQPYDRVLREEELEREAFEELVEYIAMNPERGGLVPPGRYREYEFTGCLVPGYPELKLWTSDYWDRFWRTYSYLAATDLFSREPAK